MRLLTKLLKLRAAVDEVLEELNEDDQESGEELAESEILLTRSAKNRRSDKNEVMTMHPLNGAPAVPEGWVKGVSMRGDGNRQLLAKILQEYDPMSRREIWDVSRELEPRVRKRTEMANFQQMVNRLVKVGQLRLKSGKLVRKG